MLERNKAFRKELLSRETSFICEAHNGLSAKIVEESGFSGIWASGLSISAQYGLRDNNEASWSQVLDAVEFMADASTIPILVDGDTGFGNFNNFRKFVRKLEQVGASAVCIEDKLFPKKNSFIDGHKQELADIEEFCGKIRAGKDFQIDDKFSIVARVEALIAGWGVDEAIKRANAYSDAGADAVLIHSSKKDASEIFEFMKFWDNRCPVVIVPTTYYKTDTKEFIDRNISMVIWANHMIRSSTKAMQETALEIFKSRSLVGIENRFVPVSEIFRLQNNAELEVAESKYLPKTRSAEVFLLSGGGKDIRKSFGADSYTVENYVMNYRKNGVNQIHLLVEGEHSALDKFFDTVTIMERRSLSEVDTLNQAQEFLRKAEGDIVIAYADTIFENQVLLDEREFEMFDALIIGSYFTPERFEAKVNYDVVRIMENFDSELLTRFYVESVYSKPRLESDEFLWGGLLVVPKKSKEKFLTVLDSLCNTENKIRSSIPDLINEMIGMGMKVGLRITFTRWVEFGDFSLKVSG